MKIISRINTNMAGIICTRADVTGNGNNYFYINKKSGMCLAALISMSDAYVYTTGI